ncbi:MAG: hypothetical protein Q8R07_04050, partial [Candidatus Uhrbacteria bacterium]|nr:hypothetical protein [Candidatus Uhrbacteria bacterium]
GGRVFGGSRLQQFLSKTANTLFRVFSSSKLTDATFGPKMFRKELFQNMKIESKKGWAIAFELSIKAQALGLQVGEVPMTSINRFYGGESTFSLGSWFGEYVKWFFRGIALLRGKSLPPPQHKRAFE